MQGIPLFIGIMIGCCLVLSFSAALEMNFIDSILYIVVSGLLFILLGNQNYRG